MTTAETITETITGTTAGAVDATEFAWFAGIDWGTAQHVVDFAHASGREHTGFAVAHTVEGLAGLLTQLAARTGGRLDRLAVAIEVPRGALVEVLLERGVAVFVLNPKQLDRFRDRFSVAGAKDDALDARVLRSALQTDQPLFRRVASEGPRVIQLREWTRADAVLQRDWQELTNRLRELVHRIAPSWLTLSPAATDPWFWEFLELVATPEFGRRVRRKTFQAVLTTRRIRRVTVDDLYAALDAGALPVAAGTIDAVTGHIQLLLPRLALVAEQRAQCERALAQLIAELSASDEDPPTDAAPTDAAPTDAAPTDAAPTDAAPTEAAPTEAALTEAAPTDAAPATSAAPATAEVARPSDIAILQSLPGVGVRVTALFVADAYAQLRLADYHGLRTLTGIAPVRRQTGKQKAGLVSMRYACNHRLRNACYHMANISMRLDAKARSYYAALRARGHSHGRALRSVADRWLRILTAMLKQRTLYDPTRFQVGGAAPATPTH